MTWHVLSMVSDLRMIGCLCWRRPACDNDLYFPSTSISSTAPPLLHPLRNTRARKMASRRS